MSRNLIKPARKEGVRPPTTERERKIMLALYQLRILTIEQIEILTGWTSGTRYERLRELWGNDYMDRPEIQRQLFSHADKRPTLIALGQEGAKWLDVEYEHVHFPEKVGWTSKNKDLKSGNTMLHKIGTNDAVIYSERDIHAVPEWRFIHRDEVWQTSPNFNVRVQDPFKLRTSFRWVDGETIRRSTIPDYSFAVKGLADGRTLSGLHFLEYDRDTESLFKKEHRQSCILKKLFGYTDVYEKGLHTDLYGYKNFRVLFVVEGDNDRRVASMVDLYQAHAADLAPANAFLFTTAEKLKTAGFFAPIWLNGKGAQITLFNNVNHRQVPTPYTPDPVALSK